MDIEKLKALALAAKGWKWETVQDDQFGHFDDGSFYDIGTIDADQYAVGEECHNEIVLNFIAATDPATVLELIAEVERLRADAERYQVLRAHVWSGDVRLPMRWIPPDFQTNEQRIDMLCDIAIEGRTKAGKEEA